MHVIAHGGVGSPRSMDKRVEEALRTGKDDESALSMVVGVVEAMENDPVFNAGVGSRLRLDGSIQMDAAVMTEDDIGAVAAVEKVKNPVKVAEEIYHSPYILMGGEDATELALKRGFKEADLVTKKREEELRRMLERLKEREDLQGIREYCDTGDTIGCVAYIDGGFAAAVSTGGASYCIPGRIGDSPLIGCGFYVGVNGAVVTTGWGEGLIKRMTAKECYDLISEVGLKKACEKVVEEFPEEHSIGVVAVDEEGWCIEDNKVMSRATMSD